MITICSFRPLLPLHPSLTLSWPSVLLHHQRSQWKEPWRRFPTQHIGTGAKEVLVTAATLSRVHVFCCWNRSHQPVKPNLRYQIWTSLQRSSRKALNHPHLHLHLHLQQQRNQQGQWKQSWGSRNRLWSMITRQQMMEKKLDSRSRSTSRTLDTAPIGAWTIWRRPSANWSSACLILGLRPSQPGLKVFQTWIPGHPPALLVHL